MQFLLLSIFFFAVASLLCTRTADAQESFKPNLAINIPTINLSSVQVQSSNAEAGISGYIDVPWIAEYMKGLYAYAVGAAGMLAGVMFVIGGFYYLTAGGDATRVQKGKQRIADALIGLLLVLGAYALLNTINPELTTFESLRIKRLKANPWTLISQSLGSTQVPTGTQAGVESSGTPSAAGPAVSTFPDCPLQDLMAPREGRTRPWGSDTYKEELDPPNGPRSQAFRAGIVARPNLPTELRARIAAIAEAVVRCKVHLSSCGATAGSIWTIAGIGSNALGTMTHESQGTTRWGNPRTSHELPGDLSWRSIFTACGAECGSSDAVRDRCAGRCDFVTAAGYSSGHEVWRLVRDCASTASDAKTRVRTMIEADPRMTGWPDSWTNGLEVGDIINIYNGNSSCGSAHAQVFLGWEGSTGRARLANGQYGGPQWFTTDCLKRACGNFSIVTRIYKPRQLVN